MLHNFFKVSVYLLVLIPTIWLSVHFSRRVSVYDANKLRYIGKTKNAVIVKYMNIFGSIKDGPYRVIMSSNYYCKIHDPIYPVWIEKLTNYPPYTINQDGFKQNINCLPYVSIDITNSANMFSIKQQLGRRPVSSNDLIPFKQACLKELIEYNVSQE